MVQISPHYFTPEEILTVREIERPTRTSVPGDTPAVQPVNTERSTRDSIPQTTQDVNPVLGEYPLAQRMGKNGQKGISQAITELRQRGEVRDSAAEARLVEGYIDLYMAGLNGTKLESGVMPLMAGENAQKLTGKERQQVKTAESALLAALRESERQAAALEKAGQTMDFATETAETGVEYSIQFDEKGAIAVLEGKFDSDRKAVYSYLQGLVSKDAFATVLADAQEVYIGKDLPGEYTQSKSTKALFERIRKDKFRASRILNDMLLVGENTRWAEDKEGKHGKAAKNGWYYYTTRFATPVFNQDGSVRHYNRYSAQLVVRNDADGKSYLYDVTNIQRESSGIAADGFAEPTIVTRAPSDRSSVAQSGGEVNGEFSLKDQSRVMELERENAALVIE